jgi:hypothetical protein
MKNRARWAANPAKQAVADRSVIDHLVRVFPITTATKKPTLSEPAGPPEIYHLIRRSWTADRHHELLRAAAHPASEG